MQFLKPTGNKQRKSQDTGKRQVTGGKARAKFYDEQEQSQTSFKYIQMTSLLTSATILKIQSEADLTGRTRVIKKQPSCLVVIMIMLIKYER